MGDRNAIFAKKMDNVDLNRAVRLRNEYGRVRWLVSWHAQENGMWLARLSCPTYAETVEGIGNQRTDAVDMATRFLLDILQRIGTQGTAETNWNTYTNESEGQPC